MVGFFITDFETLQDNPDLEEGYCQSLLGRLRFRKVLYQISLVFDYGIGNVKWIFILHHSHIIKCLG